MGEKNLNIYYKWLECKAISVTKHFEDTVADANCDNYKHDSSAMTGNTSHFNYG